MKKMIWHCIFQPSDFVRHFSGPAFSCSCIFSRPVEVSFIVSFSGRALPSDRFFLTFLAIFP